MSIGVRAGFGTVAGMAAVGFNVAVVDDAETIDAIGSVGNARTGVAAGIAQIGDVVNGTGPTTRGARDGAGAVALGTGAAMAGA